MNHPQNCGYKGLRDRDTLKRYFYKGYPIEMVESYKENIRLVPLIKKETFTIGNHFLYFYSIEDIPSLWPDSLSILSTISRNEQIVVLFPIVPAAERIRSLATRDVGFEVQRHDEMTIEQSIRQVFAKHMGDITGDHRFCPDHITYDRVIMMSEFERLIEMHKQGMIRLVAVTKHTILNHPEYIFEVLGLDPCDVSEENLNLDRRPKVKSEFRSSVVDAFIQENEQVLIERYDTIYNLIDKHSIELV